MKKKMSRYFSIEGNIGAGKTSVLKEIAKLKPEWQIVNEPVAAFSHFMSFNPLYESYDNPQQNAAISQLHIIDSSLAHYKNFHEKTIIVSERSLLSPYMFIKANRHMGIFTDFVATYLHNYLEKNMTKDHILPNVSFFLDVPPSTCQMRTLKRDRIGEEKCSIHFYDLFHSVAHHKSFLTFIPCSTADTPFEIASRLVEKIAEEAHE